MKNYHYNDHSKIMLKITDFLTFTPHVCFGLFSQVHPGFQIFVKSLTRQLAMEAMVQAKKRSSDDEKAPK